MTFFSRDQRLHRLVFEEGGLPDGTEVAYFAGGKVVEIKSELAIFFKTITMIQSNHFFFTEIAGGLQERLWNILSVLQL